MRPNTPGCARIRAVVEAPLPLLLILSLLLPHARGWGVFSQPALSENVTAIDEAALASMYRWVHRRTTLRYAIAPDLCAAIEPLLSERESWTASIPFFTTLNFTSCDRVHLRVHEAFETWRA